jgi:hypothetical protein
MTVLAIDQVPERAVAARSAAVRMLQVFAFAIMVFPSNAVFKPVGGGGYVAALVAYAMFFCYVAVLLFGRHNPFEHRSPVRIGLSVLWLAALISYALMDRTLLTGTQLSSADRWLIQLIGISGVVLVASEFLRSLDDVHAVLGALTWGGAISGVVAALQFWLHRDITPYLRQMLPGFSLNQAVSAVAIGDRSGLNRVAGTALSPIEMGVVSGMLLPLAIYRAMHETERSVASRWIPVALIAITIPITISRAGVIAAVLALVVFIAALSPRRRYAVMAAIPVALGTIFLTAHRLLGTIATYFTLGTSDDSISHRVDNVPYALHLVAQAPWFGQGAGTYIVPVTQNLGTAHILDDEYLDAAIELGIVGLIMLTFFLFWPVVTAFAARSRARDQRLRELSAALAGAALAGLVCSATFDSFGFPMFVMVEALVIGLIGAVWLLVSRAGDPSDDAQFPQHWARR